MNAQKCNYSHHSQCLILHEIFSNELFFFLIRAVKRKPGRGWVYRSESAFWISTGGPPSIWEHTRWELLLKVNSKKPLLSRGHRTMFVTSLCLLVDIPLCCIHSTRPYIHVTDLMLNEDKRSFVTLISLRNRRVLCALYPQHSVPARRKRSFAVTRTWMGVFHLGPRAKITLSVPPHPGLFRAFVRPQRGQSKSWRKQKNTELIVSEFYIYFLISFLVFILSAKK